MDKVISDNIEKIRQLCKENSIKELYVFGSAASGKMDKDSDIDFLISFKNIPVLEYYDNYFALAYGLEAFF